MRLREVKVWLGLYEILMNHRSLYLCDGWLRTSVVEGKSLEVAVIEREGQRRSTF